MDTFNTNTITHPPMIILGIFMMFMAQSGVITSLTASGGANPGEIITICASVRADGKINNSNFYSTIQAPDGTTVATDSRGAPSMQAGDTYSYCWTSDNSGYPVQGNYTVTLCWSAGGSKNCSVAQASTTFSAADSMGTVLLVVSVGLLGFWFRRLNRRVFKSEESAS